METDAIRIYFHKKLATLRIYIIYNNKGIVHHKRFAHYYIDDDVEGENDYNDEYKNGLWAEIRLKNSPHGIFLSLVHGVKFVYQSLAISHTLSSTIYGAFVLNTLCVLFEWHCRVGSSIGSFVGR